MKSIIKKILTISILPIVGGIISFFAVWYMPARDVQREKPIVLTATEIYNAYSQNEKNANAKYLDKAVQISGNVAESKTNQEGKTVCILKTDDPFFGVNCTLKNSVPLREGQQITLKGICTGYLTGADVVLIDCFMITP